MVVDYASGLLLYKDRRCFLGTLVLKGDWEGDAWVKCDGGCDEIIGVDYAVDYVVGLAHCIHKR